MTAVHFINKNDWPLDINFMHQKFGVHEWIEKNKDNKELLKKFLDFRIKFLKEELDETRMAAESKMPEEIPKKAVNISKFLNKK